MGVGPRTRNDRREDAIIVVVSTGGLAASQYNEQSNQSATSFVPSSFAHAICDSWGSLVFPRKPGPPTSCLPGVRTIAWLSGLEGGDLLVAAPEPVDVDK